MSRENAFWLNYVISFLFSLLSYTFLSCGLLTLSVPCTSYGAVLFSSTPSSFAHYFILPLKLFPHHPISPASPLLPLSELTPPGHCEPGVYVWDPRESVCGDGEATWWHAGDDPLQWERQAAWEAHQVPHHTGVYVPQHRRDLLCINYATQGTCGCCCSSHITVNDILRLECLAAFSFLWSAYLGTMIHI